MSVAVLSASTAACGVQLSLRRWGRPPSGLTDMWWRSVGAVAKAKTSRAMLMTVAVAVLMAPGVRRPVGRALLLGGGAEASVFGPCSYGG
ncbi:hypothetical protein ADK60_19735, partial [Streptomyces sp. XY431]|uniref:hypothetical protein n=1 Tax=Streptomyces sp. XY431 TaxID=1415562 RepID=UPI0006BF17DD